MPRPPPSMIVAGHGTPGTPILSRIGRMTQGLELRGAVLGRGYRLGRHVDGDQAPAFEAMHDRIPGHFMVRLFPTDSLTHPEGSSRIQRGARVASLLRDPHAVQVLDCNAN